jgi:hypothetical protein
MREYFLRSVSTQAAYSNNLYRCQKAIRRTTLDDVACNSKQSGGMSENETCARTGHHAPLAVLEIYALGVVKVIIR